MIAAISSWHVHHEPARREIENRLSRNQRMVVAGPTLIEAYSVLTRFPAPHRIAPADAWSLLEANFLQGVKVVALGASAYGILLRRAPDADISGGQTYDAVIAACARKARVNALLTFNEKHFAPFAGDDLEIVVPEAPIGLKS
jgi:predicted nucleic acid-binding protein